MMGKENDKLFALIQLFFNLMNMNMNPNALYSTWDKGTAGDQHADLALQSNLGQYQTPYWK